jgi:hypothetical protein
MEWQEECLAMLADSGLLLCHPEEAPGRDEEPGCSEGPKPLLESRTDP